MRQVQMHFLQLQKKTQTSIKKSTFNFYQSQKTIIIPKPFISSFPISQIRYHCYTYITPINMKRAYINGIIDQIQRENSRMKQQLVTLRKQLNSYENKMMDELTKLDPTKIMYDSPMKCLDAFVRQLANITQEYTEKNSNIRHLEFKVRQFEQKNEKYQQQAQRDRKKIEDLQNEVRERQRMAKDAEGKLMESMIHLRQSNETLKKQFQQLQNKMQLKQITIEQEKRVAVSAIIHQSKKEMLQFRQHLQTDFLNDTIKLRDEIKEKDQKIKNLIKGLLKYDKGEKISHNEINEMKELVKYIGNVEQLNTIINQLKDQSFILKKQIKDALNKKSAAQIKIMELRNQISNHILKNQRKQGQIKSLQEVIMKLRAELATQKLSTKNLEHYFEQKWHNQFQNVKNHLEKNYYDKISQHEKDLQGRKVEVSRKVQSYIFLHKQDQKIIDDLKRRIQQLHDEIEAKKTVISNQRLIVEQIKMQIYETDLMRGQQIYSLNYQWSIKLTQLHKQIKKLKEEINNTSFDKQSYERQKVQLANRLTKNFEEQKFKIQEQHKRQKEELQKVKIFEIDEQKQRYQDMVVKFRRQIQQTKVEHEFQMVEGKVKLTKEIERLSKELQEQRNNQKQYLNSAELREKAFKKQIQDLKQYYMKKIYDLQRQIQNKKTNLKVINSKSQNDEDLKKELRQLIEGKMKQCRELAKINEDLQNQIQAKDSEINHLNYQNTGLRMTKDDWLKIIIEVRDEFVSDLATVNENHLKQMQLFKSKIWQLQNIINKRPIRIQDQKKIRSLSEQKKELQNKIDLKQAENIVLKQIKHYYQKRNDFKTCASHMSLTETDLKKPQTVLIMSKRPRRTKINFYQNLKRQSQDEGQINSDIKKMKKYLQRFRTGNSTRNEDLQNKPNHKPRPSSRNYINRSLEA